MLYLRGKSAHQAPNRRLVSSASRFPADGRFTSRSRPALLASPTLPSMLHDSQSVQRSANSTSSSSSSLPRGFAQIESLTEEIRRNKNQGQAPGAHSSAITNYDSGGSSSSTNETADEDVMDLDAELLLYQAGRDSGGLNEHQHSTAGVVRGLSRRPLSAVDRDSYIPTAQEASEKRLFEEVISESSSFASTSSGTGRKKRGRKGGVGCAADDHSHVSPQEEAVGVETASETSRAAAAQNVPEGEDDIELVDQFGRLLDPQTGLPCASADGVDDDDVDAASGGKGFTAKSKSATTGERDEPARPRAEAAIHEEVRDSLDYFSDKFLKSKRSEQDVDTATSTPDSPDYSEDEIPTVEQTAKMTPAQLFLQENRERLLKKAQQYYFERETRDMTTNTEEDWAYFQEPVVRPPKGHLWSMTDDLQNDFEDTNRAQKVRVRPEDFQKGVLPSPELLRDLLLQEEATDVRIVNLEECGRRDVGSYVITATGQTSEHAVRMGRLLFKTVRALEIPFVRPFCSQQRHDQWIQARLGPIAVHIFTPEIRKFYKLEELYESPETFFRPGDFPHFALDSMEYAMRTNLVEPDDTVATEVLEKVYDSERDGKDEVSQLLATQ
ncbi:unnamed protein product [Amoebophrya sp. A120]|nr:unnamed protein product [Amoebophrya sp. A120]|eukprot:GSA120T00003755001.1